MGCGALRQARQTGTREISERGLLQILQSSGKKSEKRPCETLRTTGKLKIEGNTAANLLLEKTHLQQHRYCTTTHASRAASLRAKRRMPAISRIPAATYTAAAIEMAKPRPYRPPSQPTTTGAVPPPPSHPTMFMKP